MKRFWKTAAVHPLDGGFSVALDGKPLRSPAKRPVVLPNEGLARAVAGEWAELAPEFNPQALVLTRLANTAIDRIPDLRAETVEEMVAYAGTDLLCYRADRPADLVERQARAWDPVLDWAKARFDIEPRVTSGLMPVSQPVTVIERARAAFAWRADMELASLHMLVGGLGSALLALALAEGELDFDAAWAAARIDEDYSAQMWGEDAEAAGRARAARADLAAAHRFMVLARDPA